MVRRMMRCAEDFQAVAPPNASTDERALVAAQASASVASVSTERRTCCAQERARADAAQARYEALRLAEIEARSRAGSYKGLFEQCRAKLNAVREELKRICRTAKDALAVQAERDRLQRLLDEAGVDTRKRATVTSLRIEVGRLSGELAKEKEKNRQLEEHKAALEQEVETLRSTRSVLSGAVFGSRSERQSKPGSARARGQPKGKPGHGRSARPALETKDERHDPPAHTRLCSCCGKPYVANGERVSELIEITVKAHVRRIVRRRWRAACECDGSPAEVCAEPPPRLFTGTAFGISVWVRYLYERYANHRPCRQVAAWLCDQGLAMSPGTLADTTQRFVALFEPLYDALLAHQNRATVLHADETSWRIQALGTDGSSRRAWLWTSVSSDAVLFHIDPSRSAEAARKLLTGLVGPVFVVCDRFSAYKKLARDLAGMVVLCWCWAHIRRDYIKCAAGHDTLEPWRDQWLQRIGGIYHLNKARLAHYTPGAPLQSAAFETAHSALNDALDALFAQAERERAALAHNARQLQPLRSMLEHREGLTRFVAHPQIAMDNNIAESSHRVAVIGRKLSFGSDSLDGARLTAVMYSVLGTLEKNGLDVQRWLTDWLTACAEHGRSPPRDLQAWLPWTMSEDRARAYTKAT